LTLPFLRDALRLFNVFRSLGYGSDKVRPIVNRVERSPGDLTEQDAARILATKIFAAIPNHYKSVTASVNQGIPIMKLDRNSPVSQSLRDLVGRIATSPHPPSKGLFARFLSRP
jgi:pilus assembly protein CpaE